MAVKSSDGMELHEKLAKLVRNQSELSRMTGIAQSAISEAASPNEKRRRRLYVDQAFRIAKALGVSLDYLADDSLNEPPSSPELTEDERVALEVYRDLRAELGIAKTLRILSRLPAIDTPPEIRYGKNVEVPSREKKRSG